MAKLEIELVKSPIGYKPDQRSTVKALGLRKIRDKVVKDDTPQIRGMIEKIKHLVRVREIEKGE
ncbi:50S ribosomal protein L30 [Pseudothermotoga thermarum]|uniref:Large ribosomal subunit protein uL30 n=1 Tax=Pseudothermotoga thermarum DSM 5069 TaxID=688269 RepID=F7YX40_9THEM|nr:50S ribosomal protein L30 [Pseudothermotoga thermarum]AEH50811.1 LSU ribosomal protein L30P [Pseudothermotoga thermarum DSM 5069]